MSWINDCQHNFVRCTMVKKLSLHFGLAGSLRRCSRSCHTSKISKYMAHPLLRCVLVRLTASSCLWVFDSATRSHSDVRPHSVSPQSMPKAKRASDTSADVRTRQVLPLCPSRLCLSLIHGPLDCKAPLNHVFPTANNPRMVLRVTLY